MLRLEGVDRQGRLTTARSVVHPYSYTTYPGIFLLTGVVCRSFPICHSPNTANGISTLALRVKETHEPIVGILLRQLGLLLFDLVLVLGFVFRSEARKESCRDCFAEIFARRIYVSLVDLDSVEHD